MLIGSFDLIVLLVGVLVYVLASNPKVCEVGRLAILASLIGLCVAFGARFITLVGAR